MSMNPATTWRRPGARLPSPTYPPPPPPAAPNAPPRDNHVYLPPPPPRIGGAPELPGGPNSVGGAPGLGPAPGRGNADALIGRLGAGGGPAPNYARPDLGGPARNNDWEDLAYGGFQRGFDPGRQFQGQNLRSEIWNDAAVGQKAQQRAAGTIRAFQDAERYAADAAARGGSVDPTRIAALRARAGIEGAGALNSAYRDAQLEAAQMNAEQEARAAANQRENFSTDINARLGLGRLGMDTATTAGQFGLERRGQDQARDLAGLSAGVTMRGQDVESDLGHARLDADMMENALQAELGLRGQDIGYAEERGRQGLEGRSQDLAQRGQDIGYATERGRQGLEGRSQDVAQRGQDVGYQETGYQGEIAQRGQDFSGAANRRAAANDAARNEQSRRQQEFENRLRLYRMGLGPAPTSGPGQGPPQFGPSGRGAYF